MLLLVALIKNIKFIVRSNLSISDVFFRYKVDIDALATNVEIIIHALASQLFNLSESDEVFSQSLVCCHLFYFFLQHVLLKYCNLIVNFICIKNGTCLQIVNTM